MKWLNKILKKTMHEVEEEMFADVNLSDLEELVAFKPEPLRIPIKILVDGKDPEPMSKEQIRKIVDLTKDETLLVEIERYIGQQFKELALTPAGPEANLVRGKLLGVNEFYRELLQIEFEARNSIEEEAMEPDGADVES